MRCDLKEPGAGTQALGGEGNHTESWYRNWSWCISALPLRERGTHSCIQGLDGVPAHWKCHHSSTADLHEIRERLRPDCRGREAQLLNAYIRVIFFPRVGVPLGLNEHFCEIFKLKCNERLSVTKKIACNCFEKRHEGHKFMIPKMSCQAAIIVCFLDTKKKKKLPGIINSSFLSSAPSVIHSAATATSWKDANCPFLRCFSFYSP